MSRMRMSPASYMCDKTLIYSIALLREDPVLFRRLVIRTSRLREIMQRATWGKWINSGLPWDKTTACHNLKPDSFEVRPSLVMTRYKLGGIP